ncbi:hypothetical protein TgHK011_009466 [Trichoderma gracile]|nr:hypothetical protein TgHK011_009466 [Trichoderma gracile]
MLLEQRSEEIHASLEPLCQVRFPDAALTACRSGTHGSEGREQDEGIDRTDEVLFLHRFFVCFSIRNLSRACATRGKRRQFERRSKSLVVLVGCACAQKTYLHLREMSTRSRNVQLVIDRERAIYAAWGAWHGCEHLVRARPVDAGPGVEGDGVAGGSGGPGRFGVARKTVRGRLRMR